MIAGNDLWRNLCTSLLYFVVRVRCRSKEKFTFAISSPDEFLIIYSGWGNLASRNIALS